LHLIILKLA